MNQPAHLMSPTDKPDEYGQPAAAPPKIVIGAFVHNSSAADASRAAPEGRSIMTLHPDQFISRMSSLTWSRLEVVNCCHDADR